MNYRLTPPAALRLTAMLPASKSISNRALIMNALSYAPWMPDNLSDCDDTRVMVRAFVSDSNRFDIGAAGTSMRFLTAFLSKIAGVWEITGSERMRRRPIRILVDALRQCGAQIEYLGEEGYPPLRITGRALHGGDLSLDGSVSSQYISALLMIAPTMILGLHLTLTGKIISRPYIRMTLGMLADYGIKADWIDNVIRIAPQQYHPTLYHVENDWSAASYWYELMALAPAGSEVALPGLRRHSLQGDARIAELFEPLGVETTFEDNGVRLSKYAIQTSEDTSSLSPETKLLPTRYEADLTDQPDLAQTLVVTCALLGIKFRFTGLESLKIKETDRIEALKAELRKLGFVVQSETDSVLYWDGEMTASGTDIHIKTYDDHRMAMAFAPAAFRFPGIVIDDAGVVSKSYPTFWDELRKAGFTTEQTQDSSH